uniref:RING-type domain-containing protein n=1 Tax=viral metagenome TaxID=1070528 RepID=A0A6C0AZU8_9ZZZZ
MSNREYQYSDDIIELLMHTIIYNNIIYDVPAPYGNSTIQTSLYERNPIKHVITDEVKKSLIPISYKDAIGKEECSTCSITFDSFQEEDQIIQLPCKHCFFVEPIIKWLTEESCECPVCRYKFESKEIKCDTTSTSTPSVNELIHNPSDFFYIPYNYDY